MRFGLAGVCKVADTSIYKQRARVAVFVRVFFTSECMGRETIETASVSIKRLISYFGSPLTSHDIRLVSDGSVRQVDRPLSSWSTATALE